MSIIGIRDIPPKLSLSQLVRKLAHVLNGQFEVFSATDKQKSKTCYLKLSPKLDKYATIEIINNARFPFQLQAFLPENDNIKMPQKTYKIPNTLRRALKIPLNFASEQILNVTHGQILTEMLSKFTKLYDLSHSTDHYLLKTLWQIYGEPFLPNKDVMNPFLRKFSYNSVQRSERIYNLLTVKIPAQNLMNILKCDGTVISGSKFIIRRLDSKKHANKLTEIRRMVSE